MGTPVRPADRSIESEADAIVVAEAVRGHGDAMRILFERYSRTVVNIARRCLRDEGEAQDVCQQVYLEAYCSIDTFDAAKGPFKNWLLRRALHRSLNRRKYLEAEGFYSSSTLREDNLPNIPDSGTQPQFRMLPAELSILTTELLDTLKPRERQVIDLMFCEALTQREAASQLGITVHAVRHSLQLGLKRMHLALSSKNGSGGEGKDTQHA